MKEPWRYTYIYSNSDLIEYLRKIRRNEPLSISATYLLKREVILQAEERGLIKLPEGTIRGNCDQVPFNQLTILNEEIMKDETSRTP
jgi:hypothetical protein